MKKIFLILISLITIFSLKAQTREELENKRKKALDEIIVVDNLLKNTEQKKNESLNAIKVIGKKLTLRETIINGIEDEITLLSERIDLNSLAIEMMEDDLAKIRTEYERAIINSYKYNHINEKIIFILSAKDFNQGYRRLKYLQQLGKFRRNESEVISDLKVQIGSSADKLKEDMARLTDLRKKEEQQKSALQYEQNRKQKMVRNFSNQEKQLRKDLEEKKLIAAKIEKEIKQLIEEEKRKAEVAIKESPEQKLISDNFADNKGRLPWPVDKGIITSHFGIQNHPVLKYVTENNVGIEITGAGDMAVRSIFKGEVARVFSIPGANWTVIIRHGKYLSVYTNIVKVNVKMGDRIDTKENLGVVYTENGNSVLKFMIFESKYLDPEEWISKN